MPGAYLWAWGAGAWRKVLADAAGHLQVDVLSSTLPALAATAAHQVTMITALELIDDLQAALASVGGDELLVNEQFGGNVYSKTMTMTDDNPTRFEAASKLLRDIVIIVKTHPMLLGETGVVVYPVGVNEAVGFTKVDISTLWFQNANAGDNGVISILGTEE